MLKRLNRSASIKLSLATNGKLLVTAPPLVPKFIIDRFVNNQSDWIEKQKRRMSLKQLVSPSLNWEERILSYLGSLYSIKVLNDPGNKIELIGRDILVRPITGQEKDARRTIVNWLKLEAEKYISGRVFYWSEQMKTKYGSVRFGQQASRWGSCSGENNLRFNWRLIHFPKAVIDYVVIHELAHTVHHDHSTYFWNLVEKYCSDWRAQRRFLKQQAVAIETI